MCLLISLILGASARQVYQIFQDAHKNAQKLSQVHIRISRPSCFRPRSFDFFKLFKVTLRQAQSKVLALSERSESKCAARGNRNPVSSLARTHSTTKPWPQYPIILVY